MDLVTLLPLILVPHYLYLIDSGTFRNLRITWLPCVYMKALSRHRCVVMLFVMRFSKIAKGDYSIRHVCLSVCPHGRTRIPLCGFL